MTAVSPITIMITIMVRKHSHNLPTTPATDFQLPTSTTRQIGGRIFLERDEDKDSGCIPLDLYHILYLNLCALPVRDEEKD